MGGSWRNHIPHSGRAGALSCVAHRISNPTVWSDHTKTDFHAAGFSQNFQENVGLCLFSLHICLAACLTIDIRVARLVHVFPAQLRWFALFQYGMSSIRQSWGHNGHWVLDLHSTEGCVKHGSWYWNLFIETWGGTGSVFSTQWEAFMVKAMNLGRGSATWVHHGKLSARLAFNWSTKQGCGRWYWSLFLRHEMVLAVSVVHNAGNTHGCVKHGRLHWILLIETFGGVYTMRGIHGCVKHGRW